ncbi:5-oxoprolinase subunit PxpB [Colwellia hornerae]|uniref:5-oxoprolinase subunit PxpB n=1 Tax=Colwellia hornerae TaxID=89402 RepID=A0A5C6QJ55_9GAMM|nr:5-oxoprolinase subunit PxpB [Colwellia hornerae]TWX53413.1 5-oxoprolinase subunit PxpB [Colwellia hornerae]TWX60233.1 5-oxoprolinase subunit PxpB [Colwellia hornerae]TWX68974.1 5-oxoprolinase subunit PxpB [Colwellia hornerae]
MSAVFKIEIAGENSLILYFDKPVNDEVSAKVQQVQWLIRQEMSNDIIDLIPSYTSILVVFNLYKIDHQQITKKLQKLLINLPVINNIQGALIELPVYYASESGPDLAAIAQYKDLTIEQIITLHQQQEYHVYAIGFAPGFAYLGEIDERIAMPRLSTPRMKVPKGAVAIADRQTAVYPSTSPGGWNIIGLCPTEMFNANKTPVMPVQVGDRVKFKAISKDEFFALGGVLGAAYD